MENVTIIGGGIIGLCSAYYLNKENYDVTVIERGDITDGCSFGNMGFISPSHFVPLASPGIISEGIRYMLSSSSPFYVKPRLNRDFLDWGYQFYKNSKALNSKKNALSLHNILQLSRSLIGDLKADLGDTFDLEEKGCLMICKHKAILDHEFEMSEVAEKMGLKTECLNEVQVQQLEPDVEMAVSGAVLFKDDCHFDPGKLMKELKKYLESTGVKFQLGITVSGFKKEKNKITGVITDKGNFPCNNLVVSTGSWLPVISKMLGVKLLLQPGKGYSYTYEHVQKNVRYPAIMVDGRCAISPWGHKLRIGGTMELSGINGIVLEKRMQGIYNSAKSFYPGLKIESPVKEKIWHGLRPVTPDGLPYIGSVQNLDNVVFAGGHAMLGVSLGTGTGKLVSQLVQKKKTAIDVTPFLPARF